MKLFNIIVGLVLLVLGAYTTFQAWRAAAAGHLMSSASYTGAVMFALGCFRLVRVALPANVALRYIFLAAAIGLGYADTAAIKAAYPDAISVVPSAPFQH